jgi:TusA-related sulfurtransferase
MKAKKYTIEEITTKKRIEEMNENECVDFLADNYGFLGVDKNGLVKNKDNRNNIDLLRRECQAQHDYNIQTKAEPIEFQNWENNSRKFTVNYLKQ